MIGKFNMNFREEKDNLLFNTIAKKYGQKDIVPSSSIARKFQLESLVDFIRREFNRTEFKTILEIGCGVGATSSYLEGKYINYIGVDYSKEFIELANQRYSKVNVEYYCSNIKELKINKKLDLVLGIGVLHHISDIKKALDELRKLSTSNTIFAFIEPNSENFLIQFMRTVRKKMDSSYSDDQIYFKKKELEDLFIENGFNSVITKYEGYLSPPLAQVILRPQFLFKPISKLLIWLDFIIQKYFNSSLSWNIMVVVK